MVTRRTFVKGAAVAPIAGVLVLRGGSWARAQNDPIAIGSKDFTEQLILGEMYAMLLEQAGMTVERKLNLGGTAIAQEALVAGEIDLYPEYTGTGLTAVLGLEVPSAQAGATPMATPVATPGTPTTGGIDQLVYQTVAEGYKTQFNLVWLDQSPFNNTQALAVKRTFSEENNLTTISQMVAMADQLKISAPPDFEERPDGLVGLKEVYGDFEFGEIIAVAPGIKYQTLLDDQAQVVLAFGTDGQIAGYDLVLLEDDKGLWPPYHVAPVVRQETLDAHPDLAATLNQVAPLLTDEIMAGLNWQVDGDEKKEPADVAQQFLTEQGLL